jgi:predicted MFS family arabinose efflux permease
MLKLSRDNRILMTALFLWGIGEGLFAYLIPLYLGELGANPVQIGSILAVTAAVSSLTHLPAGYVTDRVGRKPVFVSGFVLGAAATLCMYLAPGLGLFFPAYVLYTLTSFISGPLNAYMAGARGKLSVQRAITLVWTGYWVSMIISPAMGGWIAQLYGIRILFGISLFLFVLSLALMLLLSPQPPPAAAPRHIHGTFRNLGLRFNLFLGVVFAVFFSMQVGMPLSQNFLREVRGLEVGIIGILGTACSVGSVAFNLALGSRMPRRALMLVQVFMAASMLILLNSSRLPWLLLAYFLRAGWFLGHSMAVAQVDRLVPSDRMGVALGLMETVFGLSMILGPIVSGFLYDRSPELPFKVSLVLILAGIGVVWRFAPRQPAQADLHLVTAGKAEGGLT